MNYLVIKTTDTHNELVLDFQDLGPALKTSGTSTQVFCKQRTMAYTLIHDQDNDGDVAKAINDAKVSMVNVVNTSKVVSFPNNIDVTSWSCESAV